ncbi:MAG TPA: hypothetical protein VL093_09100 [Flavipsychrobacter sp.]|nr:hypothetical protein [Flavipsychrobacter sp.]
MLIGNGCLSLHHAALQIKKGKREEMLSLNISIEQLLEAIRNLSDVDKKRVSEALNEGPYLSTKQKEEILKREQAFLSGKMNSVSWNDVRKKYEH